MRRRLSRGETIFRQGQPVLALYVVSRGDVKIVRLRDDPATGWLRVDLKREELASLAGTATESFIRAMNLLKKEGIIETKGRRIRMI